MFNKNLEDIKEIATDIAKVRITGNVNMYDREGVINELYDLECDFSAEYLTDHKEDYLELLKMSGEITKEDIQN